MIHDAWYVWYMIHDVIDMTNGALNDRKVPIMRFEEEKNAQTDKLIKWLTKSDTKFGSPR